MSDKRFNTVKDVVKRVMNVDDAIEICPQTEISSIAPRFYFCGPWKFLDIVAVLMQIEDELGIEIEINEDEIQEVKTVGDILEKIS